MLEERVLKLERKKINQWYEATLKLAASKTEGNLQVCWEAFIQIDDDTLYNHQETVKKCFKAAPPSFFELLALNFQKSYKHSPLLWEVKNQILFEFMDIAQIILIIDIVRDKFSGLQLDCLLQGFKASIENEDLIAIHYFYKLDHYHKFYYLSSCYEALDNIENALRCAASFEMALSSDIEAIEGSQLSDEFQLRYLRYQNAEYLLYAYLTKKYYAKAIVSYKAMFNLFSFEQQYVFGSREKNKDGRTRFEINITNVSIAYDQTSQLSKAIHTVKKALNFSPKDRWLIKRERYLIKRKSKAIALEKPLPIRKTKRAFNIDTFKQTELISTEKTLEDMIIEQIKYGHKVFNRNLEVYQDDIQYGRQLYVEDCGRLDLLLVDKEDDSLIVVELKRNKSGTEVYDQTKRYMKGLKKQFKKKVSGIICLHQSTEELVKLVQKDPEVTLFTYHFDFKQLG